MRASALAALVLLAAEPARAWVCSRACDADNHETGPSLSWSKRNLTYAFMAGGTTHLPMDQTFATLRASFQTWVGVSECTAPNRQTDITFTEEPNVVTQDLVGYDFLHPDQNHNLMIFRDDGWPHPGQQGSRIIALTTTTYSSQTGEILDADIEFNSANFEFTIGDVIIKTDLMNTAVHEIGHILGLGHPDLWTAIDPDCVTGATMCSTAQLGDIDKRTLACDDRNAEVFKYPANTPNGYCAVPTCTAQAEACGSCSSAACTDWAHCGFCAPPTPLENTATVSVIDFDDGTGGCGCKSSADPGTVAALFLTGVGILVQHRRSRRR